ncbi:MAG: ribosome small subunit-dependent GTPase A [Phycisphaerae bacterium]|nr:ribosome small subunit-dependent GTPase A [Phycisphaerae bacterium]MBM90047.1 ribosome small subunit-dependent GTPase A [Phycisphaerae bacterium]
MNKHQKTKLEAILESLPKDERDRLYDQARKQRSDAQKRRGAKARETYDGERVGRGKRRPDPLHDWVLRLVDKEYAHKRVDEGQGQQELTQGLVVGLTRRRATVLLDGQTEPMLARLSADMAGRQQSAIAVGDRVSITELDLPGEEEQHEVVNVLPRTSKLARPDAHNPQQERVVAANVDVVVIVVSVASPPLHPRLIDRYLVAVEWGGCDAIIAVNKADLVDADELEATLKKLDPYRDAGIPIAVCAAAPGDDSSSRVDELRTLLAGKTCAFVGHSGVGKSSLANALDAQLGIETGAVRGLDQRGRHTTTASAMHFIDNPDQFGGGQIRVIDTPGVRFFGLADVSPDELRWLFPEFEPFVHSCKFNDCSHEHEPGCAVKEAVERGEISSARYDTYLRLLEELRTGGKPKDVSERIRPKLEDLDL